MITQSSARFHIFKYQKGRCLRPNSGLQKSSYQDSFSKGSSHLLCEQTYDRLDSQHMNLASFPKEVAKISVRMCSMGYRVGVS